MGSKRSRNDEQVACYSNSDEVLAYLMLIACVQMDNMKLTFFHLLVFVFCNKPDKHKESKCFFVIVVNPNCYTACSVVGRFDPQGLFSLPDTFEQ